jgi:hypothetical protein
MKYIILFSIIILAFSCTLPPELDPQPQISFQNIAFRETDSQELLILDLSFQDGDGNLGLGKGDTTFPYNERNIILDRLGNRISYAETSNVDTLPEYNTIDWQIIRNGNVIQDTILAPINPNHNNIFVDFYIYDGTGNREEFNFREELGVAGFDGRFPILFDDNNPTKALEGDLRYSMPSSAWSLLFSLDTLELEVQIQDRAFNKSNVISTGKFTLQGKKVN